MDITTYIPTQKQWQTVIDKLYSVLPFAIDYELQSGNPALDIFESNVNYTQYACGTVHCVGGWYAIATFRDGAFEKTDSLSYTDGLDAMANDLGIIGRYALQNWAHYYRNLWGNYYGYNMFCSLSAYNDAKNLGDIIHHFERVKENCRLYEQKIS